MKKCFTLPIVLLLAIAACGPSGYSNTQIRSLLAGEWKFSTSFDKTENGMQTKIRSEGKVTYNEDGSMVSEGETALTLTMPGGSVPIHYTAVVNGKWFVEDHVLHTSRTSEVITAKDAISDRFINDERMKKIRAEAPAESITKFESISSARIIASRPDGLKIIYSRLE